MTLGFATWLGDAISVGRFGEEGSALVLEYPNWHEAKSSSARQHGEEWISFMFYLMDLIGVGADGGSTAADGLRPG